MAIGYVYKLSDPRDGAIRYVGETERTVMERLGGHIGDALGNPGSDSSLWVWIRELASLGMIPRAEELERVTQTGDRKTDKRGRWEAEQRWVEKLARDGHDLFNRKKGPALGKRYSAPSHLKGKPLPWAEKMRYHGERPHLRGPRPSIAGDNNPARREGVGEKISASRHSAAVSSAETALAGETRGWAIMRHATSLRRHGDPGDSDLISRLESRAAQLSPRIRKRLAKSPPDVTGTEASAYSATRDD